MTIAPDGLLQTFSGMNGDLKSFNINEIKEPGRPFVGLPFKLADLFGGSVMQINLLQFVCYFFSAAFVYAFFRVVSPKQPLWAVGAALLKSCSAVTVAIFDDSSLIIFFVEALLLLAAVVVARSVKTCSGVSLVVIWICLTIACGSYQSIWPIAALIPRLSF